MDNLQICKGILDAILKDQGIEIDADDYNDLLESLKKQLSDDFIIEIEDVEFRVIHEDVINEIHDIEILELLNDIYYESIKGLPDVIRYNINWDNVVREIRLSDGVHHYFASFASYDGDWIEVMGYSVFRIN